jgi:hypothetical protein
MVIILTQFAGDRLISTHSIFCLICQYLSPKPTRTKSLCGCGIGSLLICGDRLLDYFKPDA